MRDYLYLWIDEEKSLLVSSGIEFRDFVSFLLKEVTGLLLLEHEASASYDKRSSFEYLTAKECLDLIQEEDIYSWGNFVWIDYSIKEFPSLSKEQIAEILYFRHKKEPLHQIYLPYLKNQFFYCGHDDGWILRLFYHKKQKVINILLPLLKKLSAKEEVIDSLATKAWWITKDRAQEVERTYDIDKIQKKYL